MLMTDPKMCPLDPPKLATSRHRGGHAAVGLRSARVDAATEEEAKEGRGRSKSAQLTQPVLYMFFLGGSPFLLISWWSKKSTLFWLVTGQVSQKEGEN